MARRIPVLLLLLGWLGSAGCTRPWLRVEPEDELNLSLVADRNQLILHSITINGESGRMVLATATPRSVLDAAFARKLGVKEGDSVIVRLSSRRKIHIHPLIARLGPAGDALLGFDVWRENVVTIDYSKGLVSVTDARRGGSSDMVVHSFSGPPSFPLSVGGRQVEAVVDTTIPGAAILPRSLAAGEAPLLVAGRSFPPSGVRITEGLQPRLGNLVLSQFLVTIDYRRHVVALWEDPR